MAPPLELLRARVPPLAARRRRYLARLEFHPLPPPWLASTAPNKEQDTTMRNAIARAGSAVANFFRRGRTTGAPAARNARGGSSY